MNKFLWVVLIGLVIGGGLYYYQTNQSTMSAKPAELTVTPSSDSVMPSENPTKVMMESAVKEFTMTAKQWTFDPAVITVKQGDIVKLKIKSIDVVHGFALVDFDVKVNLTPNKEEIVEFVADKKGEFTYFCSVVCGQGHKEMIGKLIVE